MARYISINSRIIRRAWLPLTILLIFIAYFECAIEAIGLYYKPWSASYWVFQCIALVLFMSTLKRVIDVIGINKSLLKLHGKRKEDVMENEPIYGDYCHICEHWRPKELRAHHCSKCGFCIIRMDHHCWFLDQCIGAPNHSSFLSFVFYCFIASCVLCVHAYFFFRPMLCCSGFLASLMSLLLPPVGYLAGCWCEDATLPMFLLFGCSLSMMVFIGTSLMLCWQCYLISCGQTSVEHALNDVSHDQGSFTANWIDIVYSSNERHVWWMHWLFPLLPRRSKR